jgi:hypothetical protein
LSCITGYQRFVKNSNNNNNKYHHSAAENMVSTRIVYGTLFLALHLRYAQVFLSPLVYISLKRYEGKWDWGKTERDLAIRIKPTLVWFG